MIRKFQKQNIKINELFRFGKNLLEQIRIHRFLLRFVDSLFNFKTLFTSFYHFICNQVVFLIINLIMYQAQNLFNFSYQNLYFESQNTLSTILQTNINLINQMQEKINSLLTLNEQLVPSIKRNIQSFNKTHIVISDCPPEEQIIQKLFFKKQYSYYLQLKNNFKTPLYKDRNFKINIMLCDSSNNIIQNNFPMTLQILLYTAAQNLDLIQQNKSGQPIFKGNTTVDLIEGEAQFNKISIRQVSSKFEKGLVNIVIYVKSPPLEQQKDIDYKQIRPLIIKNVLIKAKKM